MVDVNVVIIMLSLLGLLISIVGMVISIRNGTLQRPIQELKENNTKSEQELVFQQAAFSISGQTLSIEQIRKFSQILTTSLKEHQQRILILRIQDLTFTDIATITNFPLQQIIIEWGTIRHSIMEAVTQVVGPISDSTNH